MQLYPAPYSWYIVQGQQSLRTAFIDPDAEKESFILSLRSSFFYLSLSLHAHVNTDQYRDMSGTVFFSPLFQLDENVWNEDRTSSVHDLNSNNSSSQDA